MFSMSAAQRDSLISICLFLTLLTGCASTAQVFEGQCLEAATAACMIMQRNGYLSAIAIEETPLSDRGIYHAQCIAYDEEMSEWRWVVLESYPRAMWGEREYGNVVEYR